MTILLIIIASLVGYLLVGATAARIARRSILASARWSKGDPYEVYDYGTWRERPRDAGGIDRTKVRNRTWLMLLAWPIYSWVYVVSCSTEKAIDRADPAKYAQQATRIKELERELWGDR